NALVNRVAEASVRGREALAEVISGGLGLLAVIGLVVSLCLHALALILPWDTLVKVSDPAITTEVRQAAIIMAWLFGFSMLSTGFQRLFFGLQATHLPYLLSTLTNLAVLVLLWHLTRQQAGIGTLLLGTFGLQVLAPLLLLLWLLRARLLLPLPRWPAATGLARRILLHTGLIFLVLQVGSMLFFGLDSFILSSHQGAAATSEYSVAQRLFMFITIPLMTFNAPYWGAYAEAIARGDRDFVQRTLRRNLLLTLAAAAACALVMALAGHWIIATWTHGVITTSAGVLALFALLTVADSTGNALAMYLNGAGIMRPQLGSVLILCAIALPAKFLLVDKFGVAGIVGSSVVSYVLSVHVYYGVLWRRHSLAGAVARNSLT
ncbi:MAG: MATE family efflux transporter, partial [Perlucidibaca sp.]